MTDDEKKALIIGGAVVVIGGALWFMRSGQSVAPIASGVQEAPGASPAPGYTDYNVAPYSAKPPSAQGLPSIYLQAGGGCGCGGNTDGCFTAGPIGSANAPTSLTQLLNWYANGHKEFADAANAQTQAYNVPPQTIMEATGPTSLGLSGPY